ncbi:MAG: HD-GYP domain-containing protein, partial [Clostridiaceae bacterium]|nr:HD-GYP domain-containing protein [Clostridiaceae bacterium]
VAICDVYDALTAHRVYRQGMPPHKAIEYLISMGNHQFDYQLVKIFLKNICIYPKGTVVKLQSGETAIVVDQNESWPTRPILEVVDDHKSKRMKRSRIDLTKYLNNNIVEKTKL